MRIELKTAISNILRVEHHLFSNLAKQCDVYHCNSTQRCQSCFAQSANDPHATSLDSNKMSESVQPSCRSVSNAPQPLRPTLLRQIRPNTCLEPERLQCLCPNAPIRPRKCANLLWRFSNENLASSLPSLSLPVLAPASPQSAPPSPTRYTRVVPLQQSGAG